MKSFTIISALAAAVLAAPTTPTPLDLTPRTWPWLHLQKAVQCPTNAVLPTGQLPKGSISPSLLLPISVKKPKRAYPASSLATITPSDKCTIFNLGLDSTHTQGKICNLVFSLPSKTQAPGGLIAFSGPGHFTFTGYEIGAGAVEGVTTYSNQPRPGPSPPNPPGVMVPGHSYLISGMPCGVPVGAGRVTVSGALCSEDTEVVFRQSEGGGVCPMGFYVMLTDDADAEGYNSG